GNDAGPSWMNVTNHSGPQLSFPAFMLGDQLGRSFLVGPAGRAYQFALAPLASINEVLNVDVHHPNGAEHNAPQAVRARDDHRRERRPRRLQSSAHSPWTPGNRLPLNCSLLYGPSQ